MKAVFYFRLIYYRLFLYMQEHNHQYEQDEDLPKPQLNQTKTINGYKIPISSTKLPTILEQSNYSIQQLQQQRNMLHNQLLQITKIINELADLELQHQQKKEQNNQAVLKQLQKKSVQNKQLLKQLNKQVQDFQFMLTGQYSIKLKDQLQVVKTKIVSTRKQVNKLNAQLRKPLMTDEIAQKYDIEIRKMQRQIQEIGFQNKNKQSKLKNIKTETQSKSKAALQLQKKIIELEDQSPSSITNKQLQQQYQATLEKKIKTQKFYESMQKRKIIQFNMKAKQIDNTLATGSQIEQTIQSIIKDIHSSRDQLFALKQKQKQKKMKTLLQQQKITRQNRKKRIYTELQSHNYFSAYNIEVPDTNLRLSKFQEIQNQIGNSGYKPTVAIKSRNLKLKQASYLPALEKIKEIKSTNRALELKKSETQLASLQRQKRSYETLLKMLKKPKFDLQQQYDINDLLYQ